MNIEQEFIDQLLQYKHIIYKVCLMYAQNQHDVVDLSIRKPSTTYGKVIRASKVEVLSAHGYIGSHSTLA